MFCTFFQPLVFKTNFERTFSLDTAALQGEHRGPTLFPRSVVSQPLLLPRRRRLRRPRPLRADPHSAVRPPPRRESRLSRASCLVPLPLRRQRLHLHPRRLPPPPPLPPPRRDADQWWQRFALARPRPPRLAAHLRSPARPSLAAATVAATVAAVVSQVPLF
jgi:hypothetical protein